MIEVVVIYVVMSAMWCAQAVPFRSLVPLSKTTPAKRSLIPRVRWVFTGLAIAVQSAKGTSPANMRCNWTSEPTQVRQDSRWVVASFCVKGVANTSKLPRYKRDHSKDGMRAYQFISLLVFFHVRSRGSWWHLRPHFNPNIHPHIERACGSQWHPADVRPGSFGKLVVSLPSS